jgi:hypothetical protein
MTSDTVGTIIGLTFVVGAVAFASFMVLCLVCAGTLAVVVPIRVALWAFRLVRTELDAATAHNTEDVEFRRTGDDLRSYPTHPPGVALGPCSNLKVTW